MEQVGKKLALLVVILGLLFLSSFFVGLLLLFSSGSWNLPLTGNVAVIPIKGVILTGSDSWANTVDPVFVRESIEDAQNDPMIKAIVLEIDSPGGSPVASDEIGQALKRANKPTVAFIREVGASGAYWVASGADHIIANRMSITGSVGVTASYIEFAGTLRRYNATYQELHSGELKEAGAQFGELDQAERALLQRKLDITHDFFLQEVQQNRNLTSATMEVVRTGEIFLGSEAYQLGLVDELGGFEELDAYLNSTIGEEPEYLYYYKPASFWDEFSLIKANIFPSLSAPEGNLQLRT